MVYLGIAATALIFLSVVIVDTTLCTPRRREFWNSPAVIKRCEEEGFYAVVQGPFNILIDFYILYLPIPVLLKLQLRKKKKIGVTSIFMTGSMYDYAVPLLISMSETDWAGSSACLASVLSLIYRVKLITSPDIEWNKSIVNLLR